MTVVPFTRNDTALGRIEFRLVDPVADAKLLHGWVTHPKAVFWMMQDADLTQVRDEYVRIAEHRHHDAFIGLVDGRPAFLAERYDPARVELVGLYDAQPGDVGMHFLTAPSQTPMAGFTLSIITTVMAWLFADPGARRVVVDPDEHNTAVHALNAAVGFEVVGIIEKPEKNALLSVCTRKQYFTATKGTTAC